ncbi:MAG: hypothetical protein WC300_02560 [Candidatus Omnitrophota bacterium]
MKDSVLQLSRTVSPGTVYQTAARIRFLAWFGSAHHRLLGMTGVDRQAFWMTEVLLGIRAQKTDRCLQSSRLLELRY